MESWLNMRHYLANFILAMLSVVLTLLVAEGICWLLLDPVDYLMPERVRDEILGYRIKPNSAGHDAWGFRNKAVPATAEIVTIGDSQTYGLSATADNSWPAQLQRLTNRNVYNLGMLAYSPVEYFYLQEKAFQLKPSLIVVGFYFGNDLLDTYESVYKNDHWQDLRKPDFRPEPKLEVEVHPETVKSSYTIVQEIRRFRDWLAHRSILYRMVDFSPIGDLFRLTEMKYGYETDDITMFEDPKHDIYTGFTPPYRLSALDLDDPKVQEGLRISLELLRQMQQRCQEEGVDFLVVLIPSKESVFAPYIENNQALEDSQIIDELIESERKVNEIVQAELAQHEIAYVDTLEALRSAAGVEQIYPNNHNGHPNKNGYRVIATVVDQYLENNRKSNL